MGLVSIAEESRIYVSQVYSLYVLNIIGRPATVMKHYSFMVNPLHLSQA